MKKVLVIAFEFPPIRASNDRTYHVCLHLPHHGWTPVVVAPRKPGPWMLHDTMLTVPTTIEVHDASALQNVWFLRVHYFLKLLPDSNMYMISSYFKGDKILSGQSPQIKAIYATSPSSSDLISAFYLSRKYRKHLVLDYRDPFYPPMLYRSLHQKILKQASKIITTTSTYKDVLVSQGADESRIEIIPNGTDLENIISIRSAGVIRSNLFTVVYAGVLIPLYRVKSLLKALVSINEPDIRVVIIGRVSDDEEGLAKFVKEHGLEKQVEFRGRLSQEETLRELLRSTVAYNGSAHLGGIGGKVYDYLACGLPILGYNPRSSATSAFIKENQVGLTAETEEGLAKNLKILYDDRASVNLIARTAVEKARNFDRRNLAKRLNDVLDSLPV